MVERADAVDAAADYDYARGSFHRVTGLCEAHRYAVPALYRDVAGTLVFFRCVKVARLECC